ncbi:biotin-dependent carboxyltransferase family protein [Macrococcus lamae]|uniref:Biotin-dependent carboxyltransferase family protein n=1 Tax=Macrococcus lamae TaxID=198484 RepID=A0A4R6BTT2_9STAP|nr:biotin-dependent carboxyltransferase family protein [Macrococcus lamae]TDM10502.1 biotin-dependent carboxyltransferase family protein [Macrococcus lamae]
MSIKVIKPGLLTTVQDVGRFGLQHIGLSPGGAMDYDSLMMGNQLLENVEPMSLEMTMQGGVFQFTTAAAFVVTGADMQAQLNNEEITNNTIYNARTNDVLSFKGAIDGMRTYLSVKGGFDIPTVNGSVSTQTKVGIGGIDGRPLKSGDVLHFKAPAVMPVKKVMKQHACDNVIRFIPGRQYERFELLPDIYIVSTVSDRMGIRLEGDVIKASSYDIISEPVQLGSVQVTSEGLPIILLNDRQTVGGYAKLGTVYFVDLPKLVQLKAGAELKLVPGTLEEAVEEKKKMLERLEKVSMQAFSERTVSTSVQQLIKRVKR